MQKKYRLKRRSDFRRVFRAGTSVANRQFILYIYHRKEEGPPRVGVSVSKKLGKAVKRNRIRRRIKEVVRQWVEEIPDGVDLVVIARQPVATMDFSQIRSSLNHLFKKAKLISPKSP